MQYCVFTNDNQKEQLEKLENLHNESVDSGKDNFKDLIRGLVKYIRKERPELIEKFYIGQIFNSVNQIIYSFEKLKEAKTNQLNGTNYEEIISQEEAMILVFSMNAKAFLELIKEYTKVQFDEDLLNDITWIRNCLAHFYNKRIEQRKFFINLSIERGIRDYFVLNVSSVKSGHLEYEINFSVDVFYFSLKDIFEELKNNPNLFK